MRITDGVVHFQFGAPGKHRPAVPRVPLPKASARRFHHPDASNTKAPEMHSRASGLPISSGANPVASALGFRLGATPRGLIHSNSPSSLRRPEQDISTLHGLGHFYFALTRSHLLRNGLQSALGDPYGLTLRGGCPSKRPAAAARA